MNTFIITVTLVVAGFLGINIGTANSADASTGCVTRAEMRQVDVKGRDAWTRDHVTRVFGVRGRATGSMRNGMAVLYPTCSHGYSYIAEVDFYQGRAYWKWYSSFA